MPGSHIQILAVKSLKVICFPVDNLWSAAVPAAGVALRFAGREVSHRPVKIRRPSSSVGWTHPMPLGGAAWIGDEGNAAGHDEPAALAAPGELKSNLRINQLAIEIAAARLE